MENTVRTAEVFRFPTAGRPALSLVGRMIENLFALDRCQEIYSGLAQEEEGFFDRVLDSLGIDCAVAEEELARIPAEGPVVVVANHPYGALEGVILASLLRRVRPDLRIMANYLLGRIPQLQPLLIPVDPFGGRDASRANLRPLRQSLRWLQQGGMLVLFPAGEVSHLQLGRGIADSEWNADLARLVRRSGATVQPVFFPGGNGAAFHLLGLLHPRLRTVLLPHELMNKRNRRIEVRLGSPLPYRRLAAMEDREMTDYLRFRTYLLRERATSPGLPAAPAAPGQPVIAPRDRQQLQAEVAALPPGQLLAAGGPFQVLQAEAGQIPQLLLEIGRLREITFRAAGEGTGKEVDLDRFDWHYTHLVLWNRETAEVAGAYRMGCTDHILARHGMEGLYTSTLFEFRPELLERLGPALEMGRSFVRAEYQRSYSPLLLLWKGIGAFVARHPRYRVLFGPVSISRDYSPVSRQLIAGALGQSCTLPELQHLVRGRNPLRLKNLRVRGCDPRRARRFTGDIEEVASLVADLEADRKGIPVLLRQYLGLGGRILAFNIDPEFSDVLDGLVVVDLLQTEGKTLERYLGKEGAASFRGWHRQQSAECA